MNTFVYSLLRTVTAIFFISLGIISLMIPWSPDVRYSLIRFILEDSIPISLFGFAFIVIGIAIVIYTIIGSTRRYYHLKTGGNSIQIHEDVINEQLSVYWKQLFPNNEIPYRITLKQNKIQIIADLPFVAEEEQRFILERIKDDLQNLFVNQLGYCDEFNLSISFEEASKNK